MDPQVVVAADVVDGGFHDVIVYPGRGECQVPVIKNLILVVCCPKGAEGVELSTGSTQEEAMIKSEEVTGVKADILRYVQDHPGCTMRACARGTAGTLNPTTVRERRRMVSYLLEQGYLLDRERRDPSFSKLVLSAKARRLICK